MGTRQCNSRTYHSAIALVPQRPLLPLQTGQRGFDGHGAWQERGDWFSFDGGEVVLGRVGGWLCLFFVIDCVWLCLVRNSKIKLTFFSTEKTYWVLQGTTLKPNLKIRLWETYNDKVFLRTFESEESDLSSWDGPWAICCFTFALGAFGTIAITG